MGGGEIQVKWLKAEVISELLGLSHRLLHHSKVITDRNIEKKVLTLSVSMLLIGIELLYFYWRYSEFKKKKKKEALLRWSCTP